MLRYVALLTMTMAWACTGVRTADPPAGSGSFAPRLSQLGGAVVLSWVEPDAAGVPSLRFASRARDAWAAPKTAVRDPRLAADSADIPSVVPLGHGVLAAEWTVKRGSSQHARDLFVARSFDGGASWSTPARPHRDDTETEHGMASLIPTGSRDAFGICWLDGRSGALSSYGEGGTSLYWADWRGGGFGPEVLLDARVCDCCKTSAALSPSGPIVAYRDRSASEQRDIAWVREESGGWTTPQPVRGDGWSLSACPTNGPAIATRGKHAAIAWFTGADATPSVWVALSADGGKTLGSPVRVDGGAPVGRVNATVLADGSIAVVWLERKGQNAEVRVRRVAQNGEASPPVVVGTTSPARASGYPSIATPDGRGVLVAWIETRSPGRVRAAVVPLL